MYEGILADFVVCTKFLLLVIHNIVNVYVSFSSFHSFLLSFQFCIIICGPLKFFLHLIWVAIFSVNVFTEKIELLSIVGSLSDWLTKATAGNKLIFQSNLLIFHG